MNQDIDFEMNTVATDTFSAVYPKMNYYIAHNTDWQNSRDGDVQELLDFRTHITNPYRRCVGGHSRNINIFFLLAEAMWIFAGRRDVGFLTIFNSGMKRFSDDGFVFHAPYGYRLRHWGESSELRAPLEGRGLDQLRETVRLLSSNKNTRQAVMSIWNPVLDLGVNTVDMPCNDLIMFKIRNNRLITTIANRSNDLHLGLPTNVFQFSFLTELMSQCLLVDLGTQTHNSQSLHIYKWNETTDEMLKNCNGVDLYDVADYRRLDCNFYNDSDAMQRLMQIDYAVNKIIDNLWNYYVDGDTDVEDEDYVKHFSTYLWDVYQLLKIYIDYKHLTNGKEITKIRMNEIRFNMMKRIYENKDNYNFLVEGSDKKNWDVYILAMNFFARRIDSLQIKRSFTFEFEEIGNIIGTL